MNTVNKNSVWIPLKKACRKKNVSVKAMMKAIEQNKINAHSVVCPGENYIFVEVDSKYKKFTSTSLLRLDLNELISFTNARARRRK